MMVRTCTLSPAEIDANPVPVVLYIIIYYIIISVVVVPVADPGLLVPACQPGVAKLELEGHGLHTERPAPHPYRLNP